MQNNNGNNRVSKVNKVDRSKLNPVGFARLSVLVLLIFAVIFALINFVGWLHTYRVFTREEIVGELYISGKYFKNGAPSADVKLVLYGQESDSFLVGSLEMNEYYFEITGDQVFVDSSFLRWRGWLTLLGLRPVYKIYRVKSDFQGTQANSKFSRSVFQIGKGLDSYFTFLSKNRVFFGFFIQSIYLSSAGQNVLDKDSVYYIIATEDGIVLEPKR